MSTQVFFDMPAYEYHQLRRLSASGIALLAAGTLEFWYGTYGPGADRAGTRAMASGTAKHVSVLEGAEAFLAQYIPQQTKDGFPGCLDTIPDLKKWCKEKGLNAGGTKPVLISRIKSACKDHTWTVPDIWTDIVARQEMEADETGKEILPADDYDAALEKIAITDQVMAPLRESGGTPEVVILWEQDGIPCKARLDYLAPGIILDLKNVANTKSRPFAEACANEIASRNMIVQAEWYLEAVTIAMHAGLLDDFKDSYINFQWLFLQSNGCPNVAVRRYLQHTASIDTGEIERTGASTRARNIIGAAMGVYRQYMASHGAEKPWTPPLDCRPMRDIDYPTWFLMRD